MLTQNIYYQEEKRYTVSRLISLIIITFFSLMAYLQMDGEMEKKVLYMALSLIMLTAVSIIHYLFIIRFPNTLLEVRKNILIFLDLIVLTYLIALFNALGLFLLPLYIIIVMRNGLSLGIEYFYTSIALAGICWGLLVKYSAYWSEHVDIIVTFAITTLLIPLFYLKFITRVHEKSYELSEVLLSTEHDANYDTLTGIANRKMYKDYIKKIMKEREPFALFFIDLNKFKVINDTYGHDVGDKVLQEAASRLSHVIDDDDFIARLGGDEFVIITRRKKAFLKKFVEKIEQNVIGKHMINGIAIPISLSMGISIYPEDSVDEMMLSKHADEAMYHAKKKHNTYHQFYRDLDSSCL